METPADGTTLTVPTIPGRLEGVWRGGIARFAGIPFAADTGGGNRFRPPLPHPGWSGVRAAHDLAAVSPQNTSIMDALFGGEAEAQSEECLHLNIWTATPASDAGRPVMVWIHGGGFEMGSGSSPLYDGAAFASEGVVFVSINYRLGSVGFLELGHLDESFAGSGNLGLLDQIAALEWVRDNIAAFGGDPTNVTIFGESAGAMSVSLLMSMPRAKGLFHRAIAQSGAASAARSLSQAQADADEFLATAGIGSVQEATEVGIEKLLAAHASISMSRMGDPEGIIRRTGNPLAFLAFRPVADDREVPIDPLAVIRDGSAAGVPLICGTNAEEWRLFALIAGGPQDDEALRARFALIGDDPDHLLALYRAEHPGLSAAVLEGAALTDLVFRAPASRLVDAQSAHAPTHQYLFSWASPAWGGQIGAAHAVEIPFVFNATRDPRLSVLIGTEAPEDLAVAMHRSWVRFACGQDPGGADLGEWPARTEGPRPVMVFAEERGVVVDPLAATLNHWLGH
ncbi:MAG: carboxylesterase/lipase family protein [Microthrixaceae bacterium]|nr:carboxylesterase/lipase family protein [Microthrixaceae bacterium]